MSDDINTAYWADVSWLCPICSADYDEDDGRATPTLALVDTADHDIDNRAVWGVGDDYDYDFNFSLWMRASQTEPVVVCPECETVFDVRFEPREEGDEGTDE